MNFNSKVMNLHNLDTTPYLTYKRIEDINFVRHCFSTRLGGVSSGEFKSMNLSFGRGDSRENVIENYKRICSSVGFDFNTLVASAQDHNSVVRCVTKEQRGIGITKQRDMDSVDGLITNEKGVTLVTYYADCTPLYFIDVKKQVIGLAHAGWRGTVKRIGEEMILNMVEKYKSDVSDIVVAIGPAIGQCCYEVDEECCKNFKEMKNLDRDKFIKDRKNGKYMIDLLETNKQIVKSVGVKESNIVVSDLCTRCNNELLWSHRATNGFRGGMAAFMSIK